MNKNLIKNTKEVLEEKKGDLVDIILEKNKQIYRIVAKNFDYWHIRNKSGCNIELLAEYDQINGTLTQFSGWLSNYKSSEKSQVKDDHGEIILEPLTLENGIIYHFKGTLEFNERTVNRNIVPYFSDSETKTQSRILPLSLRPIYDAKSGKICELKPSKDVGESYIFEDAKVEYFSLDISLRM